MSGKMMNPSLLSQLDHDGVNPGEASPSLGPLGQLLRVVVPVNLFTDSVTLSKINT